MTWLAHFWHYFYVPSSGPWYGGQVWGNVFVILVLAPLGWLWAKTKFWPLRPVKHVLAEVRAHRTETHEHLERLHARHEEHAASLADLHKSVADLHAKLDARPIAKVARRKPPVAKAKPAERARQAKKA